MQFEEPKVKVTVKTSCSELPNLFGTANPNKKIENRITNLETDVKLIKVNSEDTKKTTEETMKMVQTLTRQVNTAFETLNDQIERVSSQSYQTDDHDVYQVKCSFDYACL